MAQTAEFDAVVDEFFARYFAFHPTSASKAGLHQFDDQIGPRDRAAIEAYLDDLRRLEWRFEDLGTGLDPDRALDRDLVLREIRGDLFWYEDVGNWRTNPRFYASQMDLTLLLLLDYAPLSVRMESIVGRIEQFPLLVAAARANIKNPPRPFVETALVTYRGWPAFLEGDLTEALSGVDDPDLQSRFRAARDRAAEALREYAAHLESILPEADGDYALGAERYRRMNAILAGIDISNEMLKSIAEAELDRIRSMGEELAAELVPEVPPERRLAAAFELLAEDKPRADAIVQTAADFIGDLRDFTQRAAIGTVLPGDVKVLEIPPFRRTNFAYIWIPGPYETSDNTGLYFIHPVEPDWSEEVTDDFLGTNNRWAILNTSGHEAYPGHYHHYNHVNRSPTRTQQLLTAYVTTEGWAHYSEEMAWRQGLGDGSPRLGLGMVQDALRRVVRFLASIGLHTEGMSVAEAEQMFLSIAHLDSVNAHQQALRGTYDPEYLNYTLGKLMIRDLREEASAAAEARGQSFDLGAFHDTFMERGAPPVSWVAQRILDDPNWEPLRLSDRP